MSYDTRKDPCKVNACRIQTCLKENNYQENKCLEVLEQMRLCCKKWHKTSLCCSGIDLERSYITTNNKTEQQINNKNSIPPYKPPAQIQEILDRQAALRKRTAQLPKRNWVQRNPRLFQICFITTSLLVFFSKPLYDSLFASPLPGTVALEKRK